MPEPEATAFQGRNRLSGQPGDEKKSARVPDSRQSAVALRAMAGQVGGVGSGLRPRFDESRIERDEADGPTVFAALRRVKKGRDFC